jgi:hypothetical protein
VSDCLFLSSLLPKKNENLRTDAIYYIDAINPDDSASVLQYKHEEEKESPYRWVILLGGFLAQAVSMCTLSSW